MIAAAFSLAAALLGPTIAPIRAYDVARDAVDVAIEEKPFFDCKDPEDDCYKAKDKTSRLLVVMVVRESAGVANIWGDGHTSIGAMQFKAHYLKGEVMAPFGASEADVLASRSLSMRLGLAWLRYLRGICGSPKRALHAYMSGSCAGSLEAREKTKARCALIGGC